MDDPQWRALTERVNHHESKLNEARERERRFGEMALQDGISAEKRETLRNSQLSARAEVKLREQALGHALSGATLAALLAFQRGAA